LFPAEVIFCGEGAYAALMAGRIGSTVKSGETNDVQINNLLKQTKLKSGLLAYLSTQVLLNFKRRGMPILEWPKYFQSELQHNAVSASEAWTYDQFASWLQTNLKEDPTHVDGRWIEPRTDNKSTSLNKFAFEVDKVREPLIMQNIEAMLNENDKSMAIYGSAHFLNKLLHLKIFWSSGTGVFKK